MDKGTTNSGLPVFGEIIKLLDKQRINTLADKINEGKQVFYRTAIKKTAVSSCFCALFYNFVPQK